MQRTNIEWVRNPDGSQGQSWNPIKGFCPVDCKLPDGESYCYGRTIYNRFEWMQEGMGEIGYLAEWELEQPTKRKKPTGIFVCSTYELFRSKDKFARDEIFKIIEKCPQHTFQILTKFPENIDRPMPDNVWLGVSVTNPEDAHRLYSFSQIPAILRFISFEPILKNFNPFNHPGFGIKDEVLKWIIIGRLTGHGNKYNPTKETIEKICCWARSMGANIFLKNNLKEIWGEPLIQEFP